LAAESSGDFNSQKEPPEEERCLRPMFSYCCLEGILSAIQKYTGENVCEPNGISRARASLNFSVCFFPTQQSHRLLSALRKVKEVKLVQVECMDGLTFVIEVLTKQFWASRICFHASSRFHQTV
jgi:hypothetical protein